jgi:hypothetical protein
VTEVTFTLARVYYTRKAIFDLLRACLDHLSSFGESEPDEITLSADDAQVCFWFALYKIRNFRIIGQILMFGLL